MQSAEQHDTQLIQSIKGAEQPEAQKPIQLTDDLRQIGVDATHIVGSEFDALMTGEGRDTRDRVATVGSAFRLIKEKFKKKVA